MPHLETSLHRLGVVALTTCVFGCDSIDGVRRVARLEVFPPLNCVQRVLGSTPGITKVDYREDEGGTALTFSGLKPEEPTYSFLYTGSDGSHIIGVLQVHRDNRDDVWVQQTLLDINRIPPQADVDATRPVMRIVEARLANEWGLSELPARVEESCSGVKCPPLH